VRGGEVHFIKFCVIVVLHTRRVFCFYKARYMKREEGTKFAVTTAISRHVFHILRLNLSFNARWSSTPLLPV